MGPFKRKDSIDRDWDQVFGRGAGRSELSTRDSFIGGIGGALLLGAALYGGYAYGWHEPINWWIEGPAIGFGGGLTTYAVVKENRLRRG